jgi:hypothetical protein
MHPEQASDARVYDYFLGGSHNFAVDRQAARRLLAVLPDHWRAVRENRAFLRRAVTLLLDAGVRQFLDIGSGMPTVGSVHEIARRHDPAARVVYVDVDPVVVEQARALLAGDPGATAIQANLRDPGAILRHPETRRLIDFRRPVGLLLVAVLHFLPDEDDPAGIVARLRDAVAPGSYLVVSHGTTEGCPRPDPALGEFAAELGGPLTSRGRDQIRQLFAGFELLEPGVVWLPQWRPETPFDVGARPERTNMLAAVGQCH